MVNIDALKNQLRTMSPPEKILHLNAVIEAEMRAGRLEQIDELNYIRLQVLHSRTRLAIPERNKPMPVQHYPLNLSEPHTATNRNSSHGAPHEKSQHPLNLSKHIGTNQNLAEPGPPTSLNVFDRRNLDAQASNNPGMCPNVPWAIYTAMERSFAQERSERQRLAEQLQQTQMELQEARIQLMIQIGKARQVKLRRSELI